MSYSISEKRTKNYFKQLKGSLIFKILAIASSFLIIPLMIKYLGVEQYGIWSTLLSIVSWIVLFDIGIGNGLRNKISEALAKDDKKEAQNYISTAYMMIGFISMSLLTIFLVTSSFISWQSVFNTKIVTNQELKNVVNISVVFLFINFWLSLINQVFNGLQKTSIVVFNQFLSNTFALIFVYILYTYYESSLYKLAFVYGISLVMSSVILSFWFYSGNKEFLPKFQHFGRTYVKSITSLGFQFFVIQIAVVVIFTTDKILITQLFGPEYVTSYDVVFKLFSIITIGHSLVLAPLWSAYSDAYHRNDMEWIKKTIRNQLKIYLLIIIATILLSILMKPVISIWIGKDFIVDSSLVTAMTIFILVSTWNNITGYLLGGLGYVRLGSYYTAFTALLNIPISYFYAINLDFGVSGIIMGTITSIFISAIISPIQVYYFIFYKNQRELITRILR